MLKKFVRHPTLDRKADQFFSEELSEEWQRSSEQRGNQFSPY